MRTLVLIRSLLFSLLLLGFSAASFAQVGIGISVSFGPPAIPVYEQPICPGDGYIWTPGYWSWDTDGDDYYWVPGTWILAPQPGFLWTPGYWAWGGSAFFFHEGYWGPHIGFYGGINYGFGYFGHGYEGGRWDHDHFYYNTSVNRVNTTIIHNTYNTRIENVNVNRVSYNGGNGGIEARPSGEEQNYDREHHVGPVAAQNQHIQQARSNPELRASRNQGKPPIAATARPGDFRGEAVPAREAGAPYKAPEHTAGGNPNRPPNASNNNHASELQQHQYTATNSGNAATDKKYQQQQDKLAAKQNQEHQKLQQQQEKEHQQMVQKSANDAQRQQMEQRHTQQTQQLEQKHVTQQEHVQAHQPPPPHQSQPQQSHPH
ncbi:MAG TPA: YXWGXW repeat-containing protein [Candidatus Acidoferrum sp.]|jgi:hypothetical protein